VRPENDLLVSKPACRVCGAALTVTVVDLGRQPLANAYVRPGTEASEARYPLHARFCEECFLVQVDDVVPAAEIFTDYAYFSSYSDSWVDHARCFAEMAVERFSLTADAFVVEVASNDGYLLKHFVARGVPVLGIEPADNVADVARTAGVPTQTRFFGLETAAAVVAARGPADLVVANNVLGHVPDLNDFVAGLAAAVAGDGVIAIEVPHLLPLVERTEFDTIYHEHYSYFSLLAASGVLARHDLRVFDVEQLPTHGGSIRILATPSGGTHPTSTAVADLLADERAAGLDRPEGFAGFAARAAACRDDLLAFLGRVGRAGEMVVAYGAAAKGNTLLNYAGVGAGDIAYVADRNPHKKGRLLPGTHIPVVDPERIDIDTPPIVLILPWNLRQEITAQLDHIRDWGGRFVVAVPTIEEIR
jgi:SAM-dependent methyltransferase